MAGNKPTRDILKIIFNSFINSFRSRQIRGNLVGEDYFGNKFYEIPANPEGGKRKSSRWFEPQNKEAFDNEITAEWESWLRGRRDTPPTREELVKNLQIMELTKRNAAELDREHSKTVDPAELPKKVTGSGSFPQYKEYEIMPGQDMMEKRNK